MVTQTQVEAERKASQVKTHCQNCGGLIRKCPIKAGGYGWRHIFIEDRQWCQSPLPEKVGEL